MHEGGEKLLLKSFSFYNSFLKKQQSILNWRQRFQVSREHVMWKCFKRKPVSFPRVTEVPLERSFGFFLSCFVWKFPEFSVQGSWHCICGWCLGYSLCNRLYFLVIDCSPISRADTASERRQNEITHNALLHVCYPFDIGIYKGKCFFFCPFLKRILDIV